MYSKILAVMAIVILLLGCSSKSGVISFELDKEFTAKQNVNYYNPA